MTGPNLFVYGMLLLAGAFLLRLAGLIAAGRRNAAAIAVAVAAGALVFAFALGAMEYLPARELAAYAKTGRLGVRLPADWRGQPLSLSTLASLYLPFVRTRPFGVYYSPGVVALVAAAWGLYTAVRRGRGRDLAIGALVVLAVGVGLVMKTPLFFALARVSDVFARASLIPAGLVLLVLPVAVLAALGVDAVALNVRARRRGVLAWGIAAAVFAELFVGLAVVYPRLGARRLTWDYATETADFPHLNYIGSRGDAGRVLVVSPEGEVLAPPYAAIPRDIRRVNLHASAFAPDWLTRLVGDLVRRRRAADLEVAGVGWVASTDDLRRLGEPVRVPWPDVDSHYENGVWWPMHNDPGWLAWDRTVRLYRVTDTPAIVRAEPLSRASVVSGRSATPIEDLIDKPLDYFADWQKIETVLVTPEGVTVVLPEMAPVRYFFAVTDYPGWRAYADGAETRVEDAGGAFMAVDVPAGTRRLALVFAPSRLAACWALAAAAVVFSALAAGSTTRGRAAGGRGAGTPDGAGAV